MSVTLDSNDPKDLRAALYLIADHVDDVWGHQTNDERKTLPWMSVYDDAFNRIHFLEREAAEKSQEAEDRNLAVRIVTDHFAPLYPEVSARVTDAVLAGIRAGRQEVER